eukprot:TRINITY_DN8310_c0_g3_i1.p1 TRINITY_DN8310_c0_g3~~TRINITY_DN8310_c0_g3_i1.p1  ORF type:complete len:621 (+),score=49.85 TRINITY_DN8310_c0_g3_i1:85-1863(+)
MERMRSIRAGWRRRRGVRSPLGSPLRLPLARRTPTSSPRSPPRSPPPSTRRPARVWQTLRTAWARHFPPRDCRPGLTSPEGRRPLLPWRSLAASPRSRRALCAPPSSPRAWCDPGSPLCVPSPPRRRPVRPTDPPPGHKRRQSPPGTRRTRGRASPLSARVAPWADSQSKGSPTEPTEPSPPPAGPQHAPPASPHPRPSWSPKAPMESPPAAPASPGRATPASRCSPPTAPIPRDSPAASGSPARVPAPDDQPAELMDGVESGDQKSATPQTGDSALQDRFAPLRPRESDDVQVVFTEDGSVSIRLEQVVGEGAFAKVRRGVHDGAVVAVKQCEEISAEVRILLDKIRSRPQIHLCVPLFEGNNEARTVFYQVMELCDGELASVLHQVNPMEIMKGICCGVCALHRFGYVHRDLNFRNVLMRKGEPVIADYDTAVPEGTVEEGPTGTWPYVAPEVAYLVSIGLPDSTAEPLPAHPSRDVWSLGVMAHEIILGSLPDGLTRTAREAVDPAKVAWALTRPDPRVLITHIAFMKLAAGRVEVGALPQTVKKSIRNALSRRARERRPTALQLAMTFVKAREATGTAAQAEQEPPRP